MAENDKKKSFVLTDESVNSYGYRVLTSGLGREQFQRNPVMLYAHDNYKMPIGTWENIREEDGRLLADARFDEGDGFAVEVRRKVEAGVIRCCSIGFDVLEVVQADGDVPTVSKGELYECSICAIGANRNAMLLTAGEAGITPTLKAGTRMTLTHVQGPVPGEGDNNNRNINPLNSSSMTEQERTQMEQLQQQVQQLNQNVQNLTKERDDARESLKEVRDAEVEALLGAAVKDGRIGETEKEQWRELLSVTPESAKAALAKLNPRTSLSQALEQGKGKGEYAGKSWQELDRAGKLAAYKAHDPEGFKALYKETFGAEYQE